MRKRIARNIARPAQDFPKFMEASVKEAETLTADMERIRLTFKNLYEIDHYSINHVFRHYGEWVEYYAFEWGLAGFQAAEYDYTNVLKDLKKASEDFSFVLGQIKNKDYDIYYARKVISYAVESAQKALARFSDPQVKEVLEKIEVIWKSGELHEAWINEFGEDNPEFPEETVDLAAVFIKVYNEIYHLLSRIVEHGSAMLYQLRGETPPYEKVEVLFHASVAARDLYNWGFSRTGAKKVSGLGQFGGVLKTTSFTSAEWLAKEIARALLEVTYISQGRITMQDVLDHAREDGVLADVKRTFISLQGFDPEISPSKKSIMYAYNYYLTYAESAGKRYNPLFVYIEALVETLRSANPEDIGYVAVNVDMTNPEIKYLGSMYEFQVPPSSILDNEYWVPAETDWFSIQKIL